MAVTAGRAGEPVAAAEVLVPVTVTAVVECGAPGGLFGVVSSEVDAVLGLCDEVGASLGSCSDVVVDDLADVAVPLVAGDFGAAASAGFDAVVFADGPGFGLDSLSLPALLVDFVDAEVSAWATPAPDASARPRANVAAPVPSHL